MYRVRKSWADAAGQVGAFESLENAKKCADESGLAVYDDNGGRIYPHVVSVSGGKVTLNGAAVNVWKQAALGGILAEKLKKHGCGSCCTAMAACLMGRKTTPAQVMHMAAALWGEPSAKESYALSVKGIAALMKEMGVKAEAIVVTKANQPEVMKKIDAVLRGGHPVVCFTHAYDMKDPFAGGDHYILAVGYDAADRLVVANSGGRGTVQYTTIGTLMKYIYHSGTGKDSGWLVSSAGSAGVVIVG